VRVDETRWMTVLIELLTLVAVLLFAFARSAS
jgi:hypothetical protein